MTLFDEGYDFNNPEACLTLGDLKEVPQWILDAHKEKDGALRLRRWEALNLFFIAQEAAKIPDATFVEVGVYRGGSARILSHVKQENRSDGSPPILLIDTFAGNPKEQTMVWEHSRWKTGGSHSCSLTSVQRYLQDYYLRLTNYIQLDACLCRERMIFEGSRLSLVHLDCDVYRPTYEVILGAWPYLVDGGFIVVHDYEHPDTLGVTRAVTEALLELEPAGPCCVRQIGIQGNIGQAIIRKGTYDPFERI